MNTTEAAQEVERRLRLGETLDGALAALPAIWQQSAHRADVRRALDMRQSTRRNLQAKMLVHGRPFASPAYIANLGGLEFVPGLGVLPYGKGPNPTPTDGATAIATVLQSDLVRRKIPTLHTHEDPAPVLAGPGPDQVNGEPGSGTKASAVASKVAANPGKTAAGLILVLVALVGGLFLVLRRK